MKIDLNEKEKKVVAHILRAAPAPVTIGDLARDCFGGPSDEGSRSKANSWVRNSVRRPLQRGLILQVGKGLYAGSSAAGGANGLGDRVVSGTGPARKAPSQPTAKAKSAAPARSSAAAKPRPAARTAKQGAAREKRTAARRNSPRGHVKALHVENFAQIGSANIEFGDLTVLVGPQATGKSLFLQWLKVALDAGEVIHALREAGHDVKTDGALLDLVFGEGMSKAWTEGLTSVTLDGRTISPTLWKRPRKKENDGGVFFIPAHRALLLAEGWPAPFMKLNADTPVVARLFSQNLYQRFSGRGSAALFPVEGILKEQYRVLIDRAVFHGGGIELEKEGFRYRLRLVFGDSVRLPFMTWTAGQREFTPLLLGLYHVLPSRQRKKREDINWVVVEEPEMGLHPRAIAVFMLLVLDLLWRGYRVVVSTHSPLVLDVVWAIRRLAENKARWQLLADAFEVEKSSSAVRKVMEHALRGDYRVYFFDLNEGTGKVTTRDISNLDPDAAESYEAEWGGLTGFSTRFGAAVRTAVNEAET